MNVPEGSGQAGLTAEEIRRVLEEALLASGITLTDALLVQLSERCRLLIEQIEVVRSYAEADQRASGDLA